MENGARIHVQVHSMPDSKYVVVGRHLLTFTAHHMSPGNRGTLGGVDEGANLRVSVQCNSYMYIHVEIMLKVAWNIRNTPYNYITPLPKKKELNMQIATLSSYVW